MARTTCNPGSQHTPPPAKSRSHRIANYRSTETGRTPRSRGSSEQGSGAESIAAAADDDAVVGDAAGSGDAAAADTSLGPFVVAGGSACSDGHEACIPAAASPRSGRHTGSYLD